MPESTAPKESVDHVGRALELVGISMGKPAEDESQAARDELLAAQVHSNLAIAQELQRLREALAGQRPASAGEDWQRIAIFCEKRIAEEDRAIYEAVATATREAREMARDAFLAVRDEVIHGG